MCLALIALDAHPHYALVVAANRDEFHARPTVAADWWDEGWLAGRDLEAGGTWLGVTRQGRWALLTNVREPARHDPHAPSRGALVASVLAHDGAVDAALGEIVAAATAHNGFNLVAGDRSLAHFASNRAPGATLAVPGIHGLSNATLDTPWPKVTRTKSAFARWCDAGDDELEGLLALLADRVCAPDADLPSTGVPLERERALSAPFIVGERYGTRSSTVVALGRDGRLRFSERSFDAAGRVTGEARFAFDLR
ncbi:MAG: NRDE family protein [Betaproteobacteria bacterium]